MNKGLYIHIPFCDSKCAYCDFYSFKAEDSIKTEYTNKILALIDAENGGFDTAYIGGGTPTTLDETELFKVASAVASRLLRDGEFTCEANPARHLDEKMKALKKAGVNRISMGLQSANENELKMLSRIHSKEDVLQAVNAAKNAEIDNFSLDLMLGIPKQTLKSLDESIDFVLRSGAKHISSYMLKIEEGTPFYKNMPVLPHDDAVCEMYLHTVERLKKEGFLQYEISNFALPGYESKHNLNYWDCGEYLGLGPAAHSFINGKRFYYQRDIKGFINGNAPIFDGEGGSFEEFAMLKLRLTSGLKRKECEDRYIGGAKLFEGCLERTKKYKNTPLVIFNDDFIALTPQGFLVSNALISEIV